MGFVGTSFLAYIGTSSEVGTRANVEASEVGTLADVGTAILGTIAYIGTSREVYTLIYHPPQHLHHLPTKPCFVPR
jgi:hypothetical protein